MCVLLYFSVQKNGRILSFAQNSGPKFFKSSLIKFLIPVGPHSSRFGDKLLAYSERKITVQSAVLRGLRSAASLSRTPTVKFRPRGSAVVLRVVHGGINHTKHTTGTNRLRDTRTQNKVSVRPSSLLVTPAAKATQHHPRRLARACMAHAYASHHIFLLRQDTYDTTMRPNRPEGGGKWKCKKKSKTKKQNKMTSALAMISHNAVLELLHSHHRT